MTRPAENSEFWSKPATSQEDWEAVLDIREHTYREAGKIAEGKVYRSPLDQVGEIFLVGRGSQIIGTYSLCNLRVNDNAQIALGNFGSLPSAPRSSLYVYFLGLRAKNRSAAALKFIFGEIFKYLVRNRLKSIYVLADARLTRRYRWIGLKPTSVRVKSSFPKSGPLTLLHTKQILGGVYGLHADPIRWNWYLRAPTAELLREGSLPAAKRQHLVFMAYSTFGPLAMLLEKAAAQILRRHKIEKYSGRPANVFSL